MTIKYQGFKGIKNVGDETATLPPFLREAQNVDIDDALLLSRRDGHASFIAGNYHSMWSTADKSLTLAVTGSNLVIVNPGATTAVIRTDLMAGLTMDYTEVNGQAWYSNGRDFGFVENRASGVLPTITKIGGSRMPAGDIIEYYEGLLYTVSGGRVRYSEYMDFGRTVLRKNKLNFPGLVTLFRAVNDGIYCAFGNETIFLSGRRPSEFIVKPVADYGAVPRTAEKFDASLVSTSTPLQGPALYWMSDAGPCIGYSGGMMINQALTKYEAPEGNAGASVIHKNRKGFWQALTILEN
jgi:hypothetical protein